MFSSFIRFYVIENFLNSIVKEDFFEVLIRSVNYFEYFAHICKLRIRVHSCMTSNKVWPHRFVTLFLEISHLYCLHMNPELSSWRGVIYEQLLVYTLLDMLNSVYSYKNKTGYLTMEIRWNVQSSNLTRVIIIQVSFDIGDW